MPHSFADQQAKRYIKKTQIKKKKSEILKKGLVKSDWTKITQR